MDFWQKKKDKYSPLRYGKWIIHIKKIQYQDASSY